MKCIILAAGYATRLYPLTENFPKPLLEVAGKPILDWLIDDMEQTGQVDEYIVVSNHKFAGIFRDWAASRHARPDRASASITIIDDGTTSNETRLGAVRDIQLALETVGDSSRHAQPARHARPDRASDFLVMAGDNLLDFSLSGFIQYALEKKASCVMRYYEADEARLRRSGVIEIDAEERVLAMEEKPAQPRTHWCVPAFYYFPASDAGRIGDAIADGCGTDAPGSFIAWLCRQAPVYAWEMPGARHDIGTLAGYEEIKRTYKPFNI